VRALIVDDSRAMRLLIGRIMGELGFEVLEAVNGRDALARVAGGGPLAVALVDWNMPEMNGYDFLRALRAGTTQAAVPVIMVTTETETSQVVRALEAGANEYVMKPFTKDVLRDKLDLLQLLPA
jgi:two-component system, chemotaxis family, chemotaxis protein CheY